MNLIDYPGCCGIYILKDFGNTPNSLIQKKYTEQEVDDFLKNSIKIGLGAKISMLIASIDGYQMKKFKKVFKENGFIVRNKNKHFNHNSTIYVLVKKL